MVPPGPGRLPRRYVTGERRRIGGRSDVTRPTVPTALTAAALFVAVTIALGATIGRAEQRIRADLREAFGPRYGLCGRTSGSLANG